MERKISSELKEWAKKNNRKPLILNGARQIGKSWVAKELGRTVFKGNFHELNFEKLPHLNLIFENDLNPNRIIQEIEIELGVQITKNTLLFLDEIQNCPKAIMALRYFYEEMPEIPVIVAGSLLEFQLQNIPFPVGRVELLEMNPMTFEEYLMANKNDTLVKKLLEPIQQFSTVIEEKLYKELLNYFWVGGMPECVQNFIDNKNYLSVRKIQQELIYTYQMDFSKYQPLVNKDCLTDILNNISNSIGNQIIYTKLSDSFTGPTIKKGLEVLSMAKIVKQVNNVSLAGLPFTNIGKQFKITFLDIGLLLCMSSVSYQNLFYNNELNISFTGSWAEQFVAQQLLANHSNILKYWARSEKNSNAEVDYIIEKNGEIIPIEVKYGTSGKLKSMQILLKENLNIKKAIIYSKAKLGVEYNLNFIPIYYAGLHLD